MSKEEIGQYGKYKNDGGPAFPVYPRHEGSMVSSVKDAVGMTLRDYFAARATEEDVRLNQVRAEDGKRILTREEAKFRYADAMLKARD